MDSLGVPKSAEYCELRHYLEFEIDAKYACLKEEGVPETVEYCREKFRPLRVEAKAGGDKYDPQEEI